MRRHPRPVGASRRPPSRGGHRAYEPGPLDGRGAGAERRHGPALPRAGAEAGLHADRGSQPRASSVLPRREKDLPLDADGLLDRPQDQTTKKGGAEARAREQQPQQRPQAPAQRGPARDRPLGRGRGGALAAGRGAGPRGQAGRLAQVLQEAEQGRQRRAAFAARAASVAPVTGEPGWRTERDAMKTAEFARAARRALTDRLGRLRGSMEELGTWFRENVAQLIGRHVGEAVRDALAAALGRPARRERDRYDRDEHGEDFGGYGHASSYTPPDADEDEVDGDLLGRSQVRQPWREEVAEPKTNRRWDGVLAAVAQVACWWLRKGLPRASLGRVLALGAAAGLVAVLVGPLAGGIVATAGTALLAAAPPDQTNDKNGR